jgi:uncharacterized membrane protein YGL010W
METFEEHIELYKTQHQTLGCKITHMFGVPLLAASLPMIIFNPRLAIRLFITGLILQVAGHFLFEHNKPVLASKSRSVMTYVAALAFVLEEWKDILSGRGLSGYSTKQDFSTDGQ